MDAAQKEQLVNQITEDMTRYGVYNHGRATFVKKIAKYVSGSDKQLFFSMQPRIKKHEELEWKAAYSVVIKFLKEYQCDITLKTIKREMKGEELQEEIEEFDTSLDKFETMVQEIQQYPETFQERVAYYIESQEYEEEEEGEENKNEIGNPNQVDLQVKSPAGSPERPQSNSPAKPVDDGNQDAFLTAPTLPATEQSSQLSNQDNNDISDEDFDIDVSEGSDEEEKTPPQMQSPKAEQPPPQDDNFEEDIPEEAEVLGFSDDDENVDVDVEENVLDDDDNVEVVNNDQDDDIEDFDDMEIEIPDEAPATPNRVVNYPPESPSQDSSMHINSDAFSFGDDSD